MHPSIQSTINFVKQDMDGVCNAHDRYHIERVRKNAQHIYTLEQQGDLLVIELGALLHEAFDEKFFAENMMEAREIYICDFLETLDLNKHQVDHVLFIAHNVGFGKSMERSPDMVLSIEMKIIEDADRLDAIGAIAIARTFSYGGKKKRAIYDPHISPEIISSQKDYHGERETTSLNHFYEKLLLLKDLMHTVSAKKIAEPRHIYMEGFLKQFFAERNGEA